MCKCKIACQKYAKILFIIFFGIVLNGTIFNKAAIAAKVGNHIKIVEGENQELNTFITSVFIDKTILNEEFIIQQSDKTFYISLTQLSKVLMFAIEQTDEVSFDGWAIAEKRKFSLNIEKLTATFDKKQIPFSTNDFVFSFGEIYLSQSLIEKILPIKLKIKTQKQLIDIESLEPLPIQDAIKRKKESGKDKSKSTAQVDESKQYKKVCSQYEAISFPSTNLSLRNLSGFDKMGNNNMIQATGLSTMNLLYSQLNISGSLNSSKQNSVTNIRTFVNRKFDRESKKNDLLPKDLSLGDLNIRPLDGISSNANGLGASITNFHDSTNVFDLEGNKLYMRGLSNPGWDVELYLNNKLMAFSKVGADGYYIFEDVAMRTGLNIVKIVLYGPLGEKEEIVKKYTVNGSAIPQGKLLYSLAAIEANNSLFGKLKNQQQDIDIVNSSRFKENIRGSPLIDARFKYGLSKNSLLSVNIQDALNQIKQVKNTFANTMLSTTYRDFVFNAAYTQNINTAKGMSSFSVFKPIFNSSDISYTKMSYQQNFDPIINQNTKSKDELTLNNNFTMYDTHFFQRFSVQKQQFFGSSDELTIYSHRMGTRILGVNLANALNRRAMGDSSLTLNELSASYQLASNIVARSALNYNIGDRVIQTFSNDVTWNINRKFNTKFGAVYSGTNNAIAYQISGGIKTKYATYSVNSSYDALTRATQIGLGLLTNINNSNNNLHISSTQTNSAGSVVAIVFVDNNQNGAFDSGDEPLENIGVMHNKRTLDNKTNANGLVIIENVENKFNTINIFPKDIPYGLVRKPGLEGYKIKVPGLTKTLPLPLVRVGDIEGIASYKDPRGKQVAIANVNIYITDESNGKILYETKSAGDGYYFFPAVIYGKYKITIDATYLEKIRKKAQSDWGEGK